MSFNATPLGQGRRLDHSTFLGKHQQHRQRETDPLLPPPPRLFQHSSTSHLHPPPPSSDDDNQPALVRYARLKQREQATAISLTSRPGAPGIINTPPNPERWSVKDTSVNVATAFHQAAASAIPDIIDMQTVPDTTANGSWASSTSTRPPRSTSVEYEKETQSISLRNRLAPPPSRINTAAGAGLRSNPNNTTPTSRRPLTKSTTSATLVPDSEAENELDVNGRAKSPFNQVVDAAKRALAPATFYLRQRSQEPEGAADRSTASNNANGQHSSYDYSAEEREFQANISRKPTTTNTTTSTHRKNRMSIDKKAYQPSPSDDEGSEEWSDDGKGRRRMRKKKKHEPLGGPLTTLPVMSADKRKRRKSKGKTGEDDGGSESEENVTERASNSRSSIPRQSVPPEPISNNVGNVSLDDAEQGLHSIPEVEIEEDQVEEEEEEAHDSERLHSPHAAPTHSVSFSIGAILGRLVNVTLRTCINFLVLLVNLLSAVFFVFGRIIGTIAEILFLRPLKILGLSSSSTDPPRPVGKYLLIGFAICAIWYAIQEPNKSIPISLPSIFTTKKHDPVYVAPADVPTDFSQLVARLQAMEYAFSHQQADGRATSQDLRTRLDELAESVSREARERKRVMDTVDGKVRDVVRDGVQTAVRRVEEVEKKMAQDVERVDRDRRVGESLVTRVKEVEHQVASVVGDVPSLKREIEALRAKLAASAAVAPSKKEAASDEEARNRLRVLEDRLVEVEGDVKDAIELGKKAALAVPTTGASTPWWTKFSPSKGSSGISEGITIKSTDGQDITALLDQLVTSSVLTHVYKDSLAKTDYARFSAGARVIPSLTSPTLEMYPTSWTTQVVSFFTGHGNAIGRPPVVALHHGVYEGFCWPFKGSEGQLGILLSAPVKVESVTVDHVPTEVARDMRSAPKEMEVWGLIDGEENRTKVKEWKEKKKMERDAAGQEGDDVDVVPYPPNLPREPEYIRLANFTYDIDGPSHIQNFPVDEEIREMDLDFGIVVLMIQNNWGRNDFTCLYRFRVHGTKLEEEVPVPISLEGPESVEEMLV